MAETQVPPRPRQVTFAGIVSASGCALLVLVLFDQMARARSIESREALTQALSKPPWQDSGIGVAQALDVLHGLMLVSGALAAAGCVLGVYALRRHRGARVGLTIVAVLMLFSAVLVADVLPVVVAIAVGMLWTREARAWFDGRVLEPEPVAPVPPRAPTRAEMDSWAPPGAPPDTVGSDPASWPPPLAPTPAPASSPGTGPAVSGPVEHVAGPGPRPGVVTAAVAATWVSCGLVTLGLAVVMVWVLVDKAALYDLLRRDQAQRGLDSPNADLAAVLVLCVLLILWSLAASGIAVWALDRRNWARVTLVVNAGIVALVALVLTAGASPFTLVFAVVAVAVAVLLLLPASNAWYAGRPREPRPTYPPPPGPPASGPPASGPPGQEKPPVW
jgi:hypothetical protein